MRGKVAKALRRAAKFQLPEKAMATQYDTKVHTIFGGSKRAEKRVQIILKPNSHRDNYMVLKEFWKGNSYPLRLLNREQNTK